MFASPANTPVLKNAPPAFAPGQKNHTFTPTTATAGPRRVDRRIWRAAPQRSDGSAFQKRADLDDHPHGEPSGHVEYIAPEPFTKIYPHPHPSFHRRLHTRANPPESIRCPRNDHGTIVAERKAVSVIVHRKAFMLSNLRPGCSTHSKPAPSQDSPRFTPTCFRTYTISRAGCER